MRILLRYLGATQIFVDANVHDHLRAIRRPVQANVGIRYIYISRLHASPITAL